MSVQEYAPELIIQEAVLYNAVVVKTIVKQKLGMCRKIVRCC